MLGLVGINRLTEPGYLLVSIKIPFVESSLYQSAFLLNSFTPFKLAEISEERTKDLANHIGKIIHTRQAQCEELDLEDKPLLLLARGFEFETCNMEVPSSNHWATSNGTIPK
ncbi:hypothetical protein H5410_024290, partial [Solanum commersonii]